MSAETQIAKIDNPPAISSPADLLHVAVSRGADIDTLERLMAMQERMTAAKARSAFVDAMTAFKADPPTVLKSKAVSIPNGAKFSHATLADVVDAALAGMSKHGLSHRWETTQDAKAITVTCIVTHRDGHEERTTLVGAPDDSGKKNAVQQIASTVTYLQRYTLMSALGLAAKDQDDDGRGGPQKDTEEFARFFDAVDAAGDLPTLEDLGRDIAACKALRDNERRNLRARFSARKRELAA